MRHANDAKLQTISTHLFVDFYRFGFRIEVSKFPVQRGNLWEAIDLGKLLMIPKHELRGFCRNTRQNLAPKGWALLLSYMRKKRRKFKGAVWV